MKRYVVTEDDLDHLIDMAMVYGESRLTIATVALSKARDVCTKVEVPEWAAGFCSEPIETSSDYPLIEKFKGIE